ncbi:threonylcarbamoyl-AMP synthase [Candidatus Parcubacteria bacterium]|nr:MAG: threonylcarbamoyl-AMP synthase [Candidatus Parcubacteria bacterium]
MKEIKLEENNRLQILQEALEVLRAGGTIVYPTETSYGLGGDFFDIKVIEKINKIKQRGQDKHLSVIVPDFVYAISLVTFTNTARRLATEHWPGPLTLVLPYKYHELNAHSDDYLALRVSSHPFASSLSINLGNPLVATSANISVTGDNYDPENILEQFSRAKLKPDLFINAGKLPQTPPSTIIKVIGDKAEVLRQGGIKIAIN